MEINPSGILTREQRLVELLKKAQNRLRNQGDVKPITHELNVYVHNEIERELGGNTFLHLEQDIK